VKFQILDGLKAQLKRIRETPQRSGDQSVEEKIAWREPVPQGSEKSLHGSASRHRWSTRARTWAAGTVAALLMAAFLVGGHFISHPAPAASPEPNTPPAQNVPGPGGPSGTAPGAPADNAALLQETMRSLQSELSSVGAVNFVISGRNTIDGSSFQHAQVDEVSNVVADPTQCRVSYHWRVRRDGAAMFDQDAWLLLRDLTSVGVEPENQELTESDAAAGRPNLISTSTTPPVTTLIVRVKGEKYPFPFTDGSLAHRAAATFTRAAQLCGGSLAN